MLKADIRPWKEPLTEIAYPALFFALSFWVIRGTPLWEALLVSFGWFLFLGCIARFRRFKNLRRAEQRRQSAVTVPQWIPLAAPQPVADPAALPLPYILSSNPGWLPALWGPPALWVLLLIPLSLFVWGFRGSYIPTLVFSAEITVPLSILLYSLSYRWIEIRDEGLTIRTLFRHRTISWGEARLFAIDATEETTKAPEKYELSSATTILRWSREKDHAEQLDSLLSLIAGKTGLPLYDLRDWQLPPLPAPPAPQPVSLWRGE
jgi:hypothetical protein